MQGFPGTVNASVTYILTPDNHVILEFEAETDEASPINMVSHSYFNLDGPGTNKTILDHELFINAYAALPYTCCSFIKASSCSARHAGGCDWVLHLNAIHICSLCQVH